MVLDGTENERVGRLPLQVVVRSDSPVPANCKDFVLDHMCRPPLALIVEKNFTDRTGRIWDVCGYGACAGPGLSRVMAAFHCFWRRNAAIRSLRHHECGMHTPSPAAVAFIDPVTKEERDIGGFKTNRVDDALMHDYSPQKKRDLMLFADDGNCKPKGMQ